VLSISLLLHHLNRQLSQGFDPLYVMTIGVSDISSLYDVLRVLESSSNLYKHKLITASPYCDYRISEKAFTELMKVKFVRDSDNDLMHPRRQRDECSYVEALKPRVKLNDLILPASTKKELDDALFYIKNQKKILLDWGMTSLIEKGKGSVLLFWGSPGTGKTMAAEAFAAELGCKMNLVRADKIVNCFFGETEKNVSRLFEQAAKQNLLLVFDECDSLFFSRPNGRQYQDSVVSREVNTLLHHIEEFDGTCILTTNRANALDEALERRLSAKVRFDIPDAENRLKILRRLLPPNNTLSSEDLALLAQKHRVSGGYIKQAVMAALRRAAREERPICINDLDENFLSSCNERGIGF